MNEEKETEKELDNDAVSTEEQPRKPKRGFPWIIIVIAIALLFGLSLVPWSTLTNGTVKDFNLLADILPNDTIDEDEAIDGHEGIDSALLEAQPAVAMERMLVKGDSAFDTILVVSAKTPRVNGEMAIEDYTRDGRGMARFKAALANRKQKPVRAAIVGDSYIEGDIFAQDIRDLLQEVYGGRGVGYVAAHSMVAGFRQSVAQSDKGWTEHSLKNQSSSPYYQMAGEYFTSAGSASSTYKGNSKRPNLAAWSVSRVLFVAPNGGTITLVTDSLKQEFKVEASPAVQSVELAAETSKLTVNVSASGLVLLGAWLEDSNGVLLDCMSVRGDSGINRRNVSKDLSRQMGKWVDYDLIILEYGINALSAQQRDYSKYSDLMAEVVMRLQDCYPNADILLLGIGDRGQKSGGEVHSMVTAPKMVAAQRRAAQKAGCLFWDTREAMGGEDAIVDWRNRKLVNGDYIHLNHNGGKELGKLLFESLNRAVNGQTAKVAQPATQTEAQPSATQSPQH